MARLLETFAERVRKLRQQQGLSQEELAARTGLHKNYISGVERAKHNVSLANALPDRRQSGVPASGLIGRAGAALPEPPSEAQRLRRQILDRLKGQPAAKLGLVLEVVKVLVRSRS